MLVTFEGLDGAGKSSLVAEVAAGLRLLQPVQVLRLPDVSQGATGRRLSEVFHADELFGPGGADSTVFARCLSAAADLFYFDGALIAPILASAPALVLKERHVDTIFAYEGPVLVRRCGWSEDRASEWLSSLFEPLEVRPTLTVLVEAPTNHRERRLRERVRAAGRTLDAAHLAVDRAAFRAYAEWYERRRLSDLDRFVRVENPDGEFEQVVQQVIAQILERLALAQSGLVHS